MPPDANIAGDLETRIHFGLSALSGKAATISKSISRTHIFLEIKLETAGSAYGIRVLDELLDDLEHCAQSSSPRHRLPRRDA